MRPQYPVPFNDSLPEGPPTLFLDIDGVLHSDNDAFFDTDQVTPVGNIFRWNLRFVELMKEFPNVQVVLHSTWRLLWETDAKLLSFLPESLVELLQGRTTGKIYEGRWESVQRYIVTHNIKKYVVVDDMRNSFPYMMGELVWCKPDKGLSDEATFQLLRTKLEGISK